MLEPTDVRNARILSILLAGVLLYSVRLAFVRPGGLPLAAGMVVVCGLLIFMAWQPGGGLLRRAQRALVGRWPLVLAVLVLLGLAAALASPAVLEAVLPSLRTGWDRRLRLDFEPIRQLACPLLGLLVAAVMGAGGFRQIAAQAETRLASGTAWINRLGARLERGRLQVGVIVGLAALGVWVVITLLRNQVFGLLPVNDSAFYVYVGWATVRGAIPYHTLYYNHPLLHFWMSIMWALISQATGVNPFTVARLYDLALGLATLVVIYATARDLTRSRLAGWVAALVMVGMEAQFQDMLIGNSPSSKITVALFNVLGAWLTMRRRWFLAGMALAAAASIWLPSGALLALLGVVALIDAGADRLRALGRVTLGALVVLIPQIAALAATGSLLDAYNQVVRSAFFTVGGGSGDGLLPRLSQYGGLITSKWVTDDLLLFALILAGLGLWLGRLREGKTWRYPADSMLPLCCLMMAALLVVDFQGVPDAYMVSSLAAPFAGMAFAALIGGLDRLLPVGADSLRRLALGLCAAFLAIMALSDPADLISGADLGQLEGQVHTLSAQLRPGDKVQTLSANWFNLLANVANSTPYISYGRKYTHDVIPAQGKSIPDMVAEMNAQDPAIVVLEGAYIPRPESDLGRWLDARYVNVAGVSNGYGLSLIYVRQDRPDLQQLVFQLWGK